MRKILLIALGLLFINSLMMAEAHAQPKRPLPFDKKVTNSEGLVDLAFDRAFGRQATTEEKSQWKSSELTVGELIQRLHVFLKSEAGADELRKTVGRSYTTSFGREPTAKELDFWTPEAKAKGYGFTELVAAHGDWLKTPEADSERKALVFRNCFEVFGRLPTVSESNEWRDSIEKGWGNYSDMLRWNLSQMLNPSKVELSNELHEMIKRAFITAGRGQPVEAQYMEWTARVKDQELTFKRLVPMLKNRRAVVTGM